MAAEGQRGTPAGVAIVAVLALVVGGVELIGGLVLLIFNGDVGGYSSAEAVFFGIVTLVVGGIYLWVGFGLLSRNRAAWLVGIVVSGLRLAYDIVWLIIVGVAGIGFSGVITLVINALVFAALWSGREWFAARTAQS